MKILFDSTGARVRSSTGVRARSLARFASLAAQEAGLNAEVAILVTGDRGIRALNREFRGIDKPTDVLSFPPLERVTQNSTPACAGDLAISIETARRQAEAFGHSSEVEICILALHGLLHLAGWDHERDSGQMRRIERRLRKKLGLPASLTERGADPPRFLAPQGRSSRAGRRNGRE